MEQVFCESCDRFLADRFIFGICPYCKSDKATGDQCDECQKSYEGMELIEPKCFICKKQVTTKQSDHLYLDLQKLQPSLEKYY